VWIEEVLLRDVEIGGGLGEAAPLGDRDEAA
jgi:hypothetical protein